jgi:uncharacterized protein
MVDAQPDVSSRTLATPTAPKERNPIIDILRGFALFGILLVNFPGAEAVRSGAADDVVSKFLSLFVSGKFYTTFSFLFGLGFALQFLRAKARGRRIVPVYIRRMLVLFLIGVAHFVLLWPGDVLTTYAVMGLFLILFRKCPGKILLLAAVLVLGGEYLSWTIEKPLLFRNLVPHIVDPEWEQEREIQINLGFNEQRDAAQRAYAATRYGSYPEAVAARFRVWMLANRYLLRYIWITAFSMFLVGMYAGKAGLLRSPPPNPPPDSAGDVDLAPHLSRARCH